MAFTQADVAARAQFHLRDVRGFTTENFPTAFDEYAIVALREHSTVYPVESAAVVISDGNNVQSAPWVVGRFTEHFGVRVEWPLVENGGAPEGMPQDRFDLIRRGGGFFIVFRDPPGTSETYIVHHARPHLEDFSTIVIGVEFEALSFLAAAAALDSISNRTQQNLDPRLGSSISYASKSQGFDIRARQMRERWRSLMARGVKATANIALGNIDKIALGRLPAIRRGRHY